MGYLIRLAHQYASEEDSIYSTPVQVDIQSIFTSKPYTMLKVVSVTEKTVSGNQNWSEWEKKRFEWSSNISVKDATASGRSFDDGTVVQLNPMEIRAFEVVLGSRFGVEVDDDATALAML